MKVRTVPAAETRRRSNNMLPKRDPWPPDQSCTATELSRWTVLLGGGAPEAFIETFPTIGTVQRAEGFSDTGALQSAAQHAA